MFSLRQFSPYVVSIGASIAMLSLSAYAMNDIVCATPPHCTVKIGSGSFTAPPALSFVLA